MPHKDDKKKKDAGKSAIKNKDPVNKSGGKAIKKWSKGKARDKLNNLVLFDKGTYDKLCTEIPNYKLISKGLIKLVSKHRAQEIYTRNTKGGDALAAGEDAWTGPTNCTLWKIKLY